MPPCAGASIRAEPTLQSVIAPAIAGFLSLKRALGCQYARETARLTDLDRFLDGRQATAWNADRFAAWSATLAALAPRVRGDYMRVVRNLCLYQRRSDPECFVPDPSGFPKAGAPALPGEREG